MNKQAVSFLKFYVNEHSDYDEVALTPEQYNVVKTKCENIVVVDDNENNDKLYDEVEVTLNSYLMKDLGYEWNEETFKYFKKVPVKNLADDKRNIEIQQTKKNLFDNPVYKVTVFSISKLNRLLALMGYKNSYIEQMEDVANADRYSISTVAKDEFSVQEILGRILDIKIINMKWTNFSDEVEVKFE